MADSNKANGDWAIVVAIQWYPGFSQPGASADLAGPIEDARDFIAWLQGVVGGDGEPVYILPPVLSEQPRPNFPSPAHGRPVTSQVQEAFDHVHEVSRHNRDVRKEGPRVGRRLYLYFAGHGAEPTPPMEVSRAVLFMANANADALNHNIGGPTYANWFVNSGLFDEVFLFMDCCREGSREVAQPWLHFNHSYRSDVSGLLFYAFGTRLNRLSREWSHDGGPPRGVFTRALMAGLRGGAREPNGNITTASLTRYLHDRMKEFFSPEARAQLPEQDLKPDVFPPDGGNIVIVHGNGPRWVRVRVPLSPNQGANLYDADDTLVNSVGAPGEYNVPPGLYTLIISAPHQPQIDWLIEVPDEDSYDVPL